MGLLRVNDLFYPGMMGVKPIAWGIHTRGLSGNNPNLKVLGIALNVFGCLNIYFKALYCNCFLLAENTVAY
jgi:hypothetical protein